MESIKGKQKVVVSTPGKLMVMGEHAVVYGRPCVVAAVEQRFTVFVSRHDKEELVVEAPQVGITFWRKSLKNLGEGRVQSGVEFIEMAVKRYREKWGLEGGLEVKTWNHFSSEHGFGSSSAVTVGVLKAMYKLFGREVSDRQLYKQCYQVVLDVQGVGSGFDVAAALFGGVIYFLKGGQVIEPIRCSDLAIVVGYTGIKADTPTLVRQVGELKRKHTKMVEKIFDEIGELVDKAREAIEQQSWGKLGKLMDANQNKLAKLGVTSLELDGLIEAARKAGALGAKLSGAGGGDCMIALVEEGKRKRVEKAVERAGGEVLRVKLGAQGAREEPVSLI